MQERRALAQLIAKTVPGPNEINFWWLGQSGFVVKGHGVSLVFDPYLSTTLEDATKEQEWKRHIRMMDIPVDGDMLSDINYILISHGHRDHYDSATISAILKNNQEATIIAPRTLQKQLTETHGCRVIGMDHQQVWKEGALELSAIPAKHNEYDIDVNGWYPYLSYGIQLGGRRLFFAGDTVPHPPLGEFLHTFAPHLAFLPINGFTDDLVKKGFASNLTYRQAITYGLDANVDYVIPCHYDMFTINTEQVGKFVNEANERGLQYILPTIGQTFCVTAGGKIEWK